MSRFFLFVVLVLAFLVWSSRADFGSVTNISLPVPYLADFCLLGGDQQFLVAVGGGLSAQGSSVVVVAAGAAAGMSIASVLHGRCPPVDGALLSPQALVPIDAHTVALHCSSLSASLIELLTLDAGNATLTPSGRAFFKQGWMYAMPALSAYGRGASPQPALWLWENTEFALSVRLSAVAVDGLTLAYDATLQPGLNLQSNFALSPLLAAKQQLGSVVLNQAHSGTLQTVISAYAMPSAVAVHALPNISLPVNAFAVAGGFETDGRLGVLVTSLSRAVGQPSSLNVSVCDWRSFRCGPPLSLDFPYATTYAGYSLGPIAVLAADYVYVPIYADRSAFVTLLELLQIRITSLRSPPVLVDRKSFDYSYSKSLAATQHYAYVDTDDSIISRIIIQ